MSDAPPPHAQSAEDVLAAQATDVTAGLDPAEASDRLARLGPNEMPAPPRDTWFKRLLRQFQNLLIYVLLAAAVVALGLGEWLDSLVIIGVVVINAVIGVIQEGKAEKALDSIQGLLAPQAVVTRGGRRQTVAAADIVPGDLVHVRAGDRIPADLRLIEVQSLETDEAPLTGESVAVAKASAPVAADAPLDARASMAHAGTLATYGAAKGVAVRTGAATEVGRISQMLAEVGHLTTPLLAQIEAMAKRLTGIILALAAAAVALGVGLHAMELHEAFMAAVGLAVAAIPSGLPAIMTITLAVGVTEMARRNAIIRRLPAVETLGAVSVIGSDKTGTLTRNELTATTLVTPAASYTIAASERPGPAAITPADNDDAAGDVRQAPDLQAAARAAMACNDAELAAGAASWDLTGNATDAALLALGYKAGLTPADLPPRDATIPFDAAHKYMATRHTAPADGRPMAYIKGAPEQVIGMASHVADTGGGATPIDRQRWLAEVEALAHGGQRVLAVARCDLPADTPGLAHEQIAAGITLLGLVGLIDPPREEAVTAVAACQAAGIQVKMITGDHTATAAAIAGQMGIAGADEAIAGHELDALDEAGLAEAAAANAVFARTTPAHKLALVEALQSRGRVVAMTGDGVNDAPALKRADVGTAMGQKGTAAAREASEMVLADDNFASIARAVAEGRRVYDNLRKALLFILPTNGGEALAILAAVLLGLSLPLSPVQLLWVNMVTAVTLALALAFETAEPGLMQRPPRARREPILSRFLLWRLAYVSALLLAGVMLAFAGGRSLGLSDEAARTLAVNTLVLGEAFYLLNCRRLHASTLNPAILFAGRPIVVSLAAVLALQLVFTYLPPFQHVFETAALTAGQWLVPVGFGAILFLLVELEKRLRRRWRPR